MKTTKTEHIGSSFDDFLKEEDLLTISEIEANKKLENSQQIQSNSIWDEEDFPRTTTMKIKKFIVKLDTGNDTLKVVQIVKYKTTDGTTKTSGVYKVVIKAAYTSN